ncbi:DNA-directed RNA polymerase [Operophtera brumata]|uniref:DNA-directed RNA polymerase n=1 Tax=Operophtera brumata TaxID=104452 RepID=A0A0L7KVX8_OPEBR|nr:DNA-directed RNA polymerase [Operophtera brumata]
MHRLLSARSLYQNGFHGITSPANSALKSSDNPEVKCSFCRRILGRQHAVGGQAMTETKVSISKLRAVHLSKLASSSVSLGQLHQLTTKPMKKASDVEVDPELLKTVREKILNKFSPLQDLRYAINEGLTQEFDLDNASAELEDGSVNPIPRSPHAVFRELFVDNQLDSYDQELMTHITNMHKQAALKQKKKVMREKRRAVRESNMKQDIKAMERRGKQDALHRLLAAHLQLLCSLNMIHEGRRIVQYYRQKGAKVPDHPRVTDIKVYNALLHGYASMGLLQNTTEVFSFMSEDKIEPNAQTFAAIFECIERSLKNSPAEGLVSIEEMVRKGQEQLEIEIKGEIEVRNIDSRDEQSEAVLFCVSE